MITITQKTKELLMSGSINLQVDTFKIMACSQFTPNAATQDFIPSVSSFEITATGYTAGGAPLSGQSIDRNNTDLRIYWNFNDPSWTITGTMTAQMFVIYKDTGTPETSPIVAIIDKGAPQSRTDADFVLQLNAKGLIGL
ncbi:hypothetical protein KK062_25685 [Fulvivirgaceae bacterium PWU5]|uniref:Uncharacterized protein n=1 Tax=Dawidia cretensis TaxID=2782350 RepID=A0AAP2E295_9BACT|nr:hypothetical protein [Dawidia cretensis]MBT1711661.1 hypothetical protein [Dawidia cretensis]